MTVKRYYIKKSGIEYPLHSFNYKKEGSQKIDTTEMSLSRTEDSNFDIGDDVSIGYHNESDVFVAEFNGDITSKEKHEELKLIMESYGGQINRTEFISDIYENKTLEFIVEDIITIYTSLTYASTVGTGITLDRFVINDETVGEVITRILKDLYWQIRVDNSKNFYFEPKGSQVSGIILTVGTNSFMESTWKKNPNRLINSCTVIGDNVKFNTNQTFSASASQTDFVVSYKIVGNVRVTVDGTEKVGGQSGSTGTFDYSVNREQNIIIFESGMSGGESVIVYYEYEIPIKITARNETSIDLYTLFPRKITDNTLKTTSDARKLAKKIVGVYGTPITSGELIVNWIDDIDVGETVQIIDSFNSIDQDFVVISLTKDYPEGIKKIFVGIEEFGLLSLNKDFSERIKRLESKQDNTDIVQKYLNFPENIDVLIKQGRVRTRTRDISTDTIWGNSINAIWGTDSWDSGYDNSYVVQSVINYNDIMIERFNFTTYKDVGNTTATWDTSGEKCTFTNGEIAQSLAVYKKTTKTKAIMTVESETNLSGELSMDGGNNWESVTFNLEHTFINVGSELRWRLTASGNAETKWVKISYS